MEWLESAPASAKLALAIGGAAVATLAYALPVSLQTMGLAAGIALCCYGLAASLSAVMKSKDADWLEMERRKDFERQQHALTRKFRRLKQPDLSAE